jgi:hypothetical protein
VLVACNNLSASVDFPWSMWAMMQKFLIFFMNGYQGIEKEKKLLDKYKANHFRLKELILTVLNM